MRHGVEETGEVHVEKGREEEGEEQIVLEPALEEGERLAPAAPILLARRSMTVPRGHIQPQKNLPSTSGGEEDQETGQEEEREGLGREKVAHERRGGRS